MSSLEEVYPEEVEAFTQNQLQMLHHKAHCTHCSTPCITTGHRHFNWNKDKLYKKNQPNIREKALKDLSFHLQHKLHMGSFLPQHEQAANI